MDFPSTIELEDILHSLMEIAGHAGGWITTGGESKRMHLIFRLLKLFVGRCIVVSFMPNPYQVVV